MSSDALTTLSAIAQYGPCFLYACTLVEALILFKYRPANLDFGEASLSFLSELVPMLMAYLALSITFSWVMPALVWAWDNRINTVDLNDYASVAVAYLFGEFIFYWQHRAAHRIRWFWLDHGVHHSSNHLNLTAAWRMGATSRIVGGSLFFLPMVWLGFGLNAVLTVFGVAAIYQTLLHVQWFGKMGVLEKFLMTPSLHRVHHASNVEYLDANYGATLCVFDRLFGTYVTEDETIPIKFGLVEPLITKNPLLVYFHQWLYLWRDLRSVRSVGDFFGLLLMPPGWQVDGQHQRSEDLRHEHPTVGPKSTEVGQEQEQEREISVCS